MVVRRATPYTCYSATTYFSAMLRLFRDRRVSFSIPYELRGTDQLRRSLLLFRRIFRKELLDVLRQLFGNLCRGSLIVAVDTTPDKCTRATLVEVDHESALRKVNDSPARTQPQAPGGERLHFACCGGA